MQNVIDSQSERLLFKFDPEQLIVEAMCNYWDETERRRVKYPVAINLLTLLPREYVDALLPVMNKPRHSLGLEPEN